LIRIMNELERVLGLIESFRAFRATRRDFAAQAGLHPSALSRILKVGELPAELLRELASFERLSRTHLEVIAAASPEKRPALLEAVRRGGSTYRLRDRKERIARGASPAPPSPEPPAPPRGVELARALGASPEETGAFALELLSVLLRDSRARVRASFESFRAARAQRS